MRDGQTDRQTWGGGEADGQKQREWRKREAGGRQTATESGEYERQTETEGEKNTETWTDRQGEK